MEFEAAIKRNLGILLVAEDDTEIYNCIKPIMLKVNPLIKKLIDNPTKNLECEAKLIKVIDPSTSSGAKKISALYAAAYLLKKEQPEFARKSIICDVVDNVIAMMVTEVEALDNDKNNFFLNRSELYELLNLSSEDWNLIKSITNSDVIEVLRQSDPIKTDDEDLIFPNILDNYSNVEESNEIICTICTFWDILLNFDVQWGAIADSAKLSRKEQNRILQPLLRYNLTGNKCKPHHYIAAYMVYILGENLKETKEYFWEHNEDTQLLSLQKYQEEIDKLTERLRCIECENKILKEEVKKVNSNTSKSIYSEIKPYQKEIADLKKQVQQNDELVSENLFLKDEIDKLRYLLHNQDKTDDLTEEEALKEIKKVKKIVVIGGHINWRNKSKTELNMIEFLDGGVVNTDLKILDNADIVLFYSHNMAHSAYDRAIKHVRQNKILFDYLPRITNVKSLVINIAKILQKNI